MEGGGAAGHRWSFKIPAGRSTALRLVAGGGITVAALAAWSASPYPPSGEKISSAVEGVVRSSRAVFTIGFIVADYKYSLRNLTHSSSEYRAKLSEVHHRSAKRLLKLCETNKGFYVKAGQFVSSLRQVPKEYTSLLSALQDQATPHHFNDIEEVISNNLGKDLSEIFLAFDKQPIAAASIAQVHRGLLKNNQAVAIKVQYPGLEQKMKVDITTMAILSKSVSWIFPNYRFETIISEFEKAMTLELDFIQEAKNSEKTARNLRSNNIVKIPHVLWDLTTRQVLTMQFCSGQKVDDMDFLRDSGINPKKVAVALMEIFAEMIFVHGFLHGDPHPGNILVSAEGHGKFSIVLLDHGIYRELDERFRLDYCELWKALILLDSQKIQHLGNKFGVGKYSKYFPVIFTGRTIKSKSALGTQMSNEEKTLLKQELRSLKMEDISSFMESLPPEFLSILRTDGLLRSIISRLGAPRHVRLLAYAKYALYGLESHSHINHGSKFSSQVSKIKANMSYFHLRVILGCLLYGDGYLPCSALPVIIVFNAAFPILHAFFAPTAIAMHFVHPPTTYCTPPGEEEAMNNATSTMLHSSYPLSDTDEDDGLQHGVQAAHNYRRTLSLRSPSSRRLLSRSSPPGRSTGEGRERPRRAAVAPEHEETAGCEEGLDRGRGPLGGRSTPLYTTPASPWMRNKASADEKVIHGGSSCFSKKLTSFIDAYFPIMNPRHKWIRRWNRIVMFSCFVAIIADPLFLFLFLNDLDNKCIFINWSLAAPIGIARSVADLIYLIHVILKFRMAYVAPESTVIGAGDLVDQPRKIAARYLRRDFFLDVIVLLPIPQIIMWVWIPASHKLTSANYAKALLGPTVIILSVPRVIKFLQLLEGRSRSGHIFDSAWSSFLLNIVVYIVWGHAIGACWYILGLQRIQDCLNQSCSSTGIPSCHAFMDCGDGSNVDLFQKMPSYKVWLNDSSSADCFNKDSDFGYGIYVPFVLLSTMPNIATRYLYALCWGFLQIGTLAGNQITSNYLWEIVFTIIIIALGLLLFAWLLGNMQNVLQALGRRRLLMQIRKRDVEGWMSYRRLPEQLRRQVRRAERFNWFATLGVNEEDLLENLPEDIQREVRRHFFDFVKTVRIFTVMDERILDAIRARLRQKFYIKRSNILYQGGPLEKMFFIVRGSVESVGADGSVVLLSEGEVFGEELLTWHLERPHFFEDSYVRRGRSGFRRMHLFSTRTVRCLTNVEAFALGVEDLEEVTSLFPHLLRNPRIQRAIRYESPYWRYVAATQIQVAWRYRQRRRRKQQSAISDGTK